MATKISPLEERLTAAYNAAKTTSTGQRTCLICSKRIDAGTPIAHFKTRDIAVHWTCFNYEAMRARF